MDLSTISTIALAVGSALLGALASAARVGRAHERVTLDVADARTRSIDAHARLLTHDQRIAVLETTKAVDEERWRRVEELLNEVRKDLKELKGR